MEQKQIFKGFWGDEGLSKEIDKREYEDIEGLRAEIDEKTFWHFLECLPPLRWNGSTFYMMEFLTGNLTLYFSNFGGRYFCEVRQLDRTMDEL